MTALPALNSPALNSPALNSPAPTSIVQVRPVAVATQPASSPASGFGFAEAPSPIISEQLDAKLGISVLALRGTDPDTLTSVPSRRQLDAYAAAHGTDAATRSGKVA
jgi:hypothetical protein